jgi:osmotically-inducible protein OsmY/DNA-binding ferritin-like protein
MAATTATRTDPEIQGDVLAKLRFEPRLQPNEIGVIVRNGVATLTGWVDSFTKKWVAEEERPPGRGVKAVANDIEVRLPSAGERTDMDIAAAVARALEEHASADIDMLEVTVSSGWVTLPGEVEWQYQKQDAEDAVRRLAGVTGVTNLITVVPRVEPSDVKKTIEAALVRSAEIDAARISVDVDGSAVILTGTVRSWAERDAAEREAWAAPGVTSVDNRIVLCLIEPAGHTPMPAKSNDMLDLLARARALAHRPAAEVQPFGQLARMPIALEERVCRESVDNLNQLLADAMALRDLYKKHHWQVAGPTFFQLHQLYDKHYGEQEALIDLIAERIQLLGGVSLAVAHDVAERTLVPRPPKGREDTPVQISRLLNAHEIVLREARTMARLAAEYGDEGTTDLLVADVIRRNELQVWFLAEHVVELPMAPVSQAAPRLAEG